GWRQFHQCSFAPPVKASLESEITACPSTKRNAIRAAPTRLSARPCGGRSAKSVSRLPLYPVHGSMPARDEWYWRLSAPDPLNSPAPPFVACRSTTTAVLEGRVTCACRSASVLAPPYQMTPRYRMLVLR